MANWKTVQERWLPIVEKMEEHSMDDYAIPEIYRAAERAIGNLALTMGTCVLQIEYLHDKFQETGSGNATIAEATEAIHKHKGE